MLDYVTKNNTILHLDTKTTLFIPNISSMYWNAVEFPNALVATQYMFARRMSKSTFKRPSLKADDVLPAIFRLPDDVMSSTVERSPIYHVILGTGTPPLLEQLMFKCVMFEIGVDGSDEMPVITGVPGGAKMLKCSNN